MSDPEKRFRLAVKRTLGDIEHTLKLADRGRKLQPLPPGEVMRAISKLGRAKDFFRNYAISHRRPISAPTFHMVLSSYSIRHNVKLVESWYRSLQNTRQQHTRKQKAKVTTVQKRAGRKPSKT